MKGIFQTTQSDLLQHNGKHIETIRPLTGKEADLFDVGPMFKAKLETGEEIDIFADEIITDIGCSMKNVYVDAKAEWKPDEPIPYIGFDEFWETHESDDGYVMLVITEDGKVIQ